MTLATTSFTTQAEATRGMSTLTDASLRVASKQTRIVVEPAPLPFDTADLLQETTTRLGWTSAKTMELAQQLFEGAGTSHGLITYHRTDSHQAAPEAVEAARQVVTRLYGKDVLATRGGNLSPILLRPPWRQINQQSAVKNQQSHESIRPTDPHRLPDSLTQILSADALALYRLIWERFIASQMKPAQYRVTTVELEPVLSNSPKLDKERSERNGAH